MLFEQESSNLYYEEFMVTDLICKAIPVSSFFERL